MPYFDDDTIRRQSIDPVGGTMTRLAQDVAEARGRIKELEERCFEEMDLTLGATLS